MKAYVRDADSLLKKLNSLGCLFGEPISHVDTVYARIIGNVEKYSENDHFVRIREKGDGKSLLTVKKPLSRKSLTKAEHETEIKDSKALEQALFLMGYQIANRLVKTRRIAHYDKFEICIDEIEGLGKFIEIEIMSEGDVDIVRRDLNVFMSSLGISPKDEVHKGYDILILEKGI